jgi:hypothetical protein
MNAQQRDLTRAQLSQEMRNEVFSNMGLNAGEVRLEQGSPAKMIRYIDDVGYDKLSMIYGKDTADRVMLLQRTWKELSSSPQGTKSFGSAPENTKMARMIIDILGKQGRKIPLVGDFIGKGANAANKMAEQQAEAANRALNTNRAIDPQFDARARTLGALRDLSAQRAVDASAAQNRRLMPATQGGVFTLQNYLNALQQQEANQ